MVGLGVYIAVLIAPRVAGNLPQSDQNKSTYLTRLLHLNMPISRQPNLYCSQLNTNFNILILPLYFLYLELPSPSPLRALNLVLRCPGYLTAFRSQFVETYLAILGMDK